jgi:hypothetical protein
MTSNAKYGIDSYGRVVLSDREVEQLEIDEWSFAGGSLNGGCRNVEDCTASSNTGCFNQTHCDGSKNGGICGNNDHDGPLG